MFWNRAFRGNAIRLAFGIMILAILLADRSGATTDRIITISNDNISAEINVDGFYFTILRDKINITANDYGSNKAWMWILNESVMELSTDYTKLDYTNASTTATIYWNNSIANETYHFNIIDNQTIYINRSIKSNWNQKIKSVEFVIPLLYDDGTNVSGRGYDYVVLNKTLSATDRGMNVQEIPTGGVRTRYATYDNDVYVSDRDDAYFIINLTGTPNLIKSVRQDLMPESLIPNPPPDYGCPGSRFSFGLVNYSSFPAMEPLYPMTEGQVAWQNITFRFNNEKALLSDNNPIINTSRFYDKTIFPNSTIAKDARHMVENVVIGRLLSDWHPNGSRPYLWDGVVGYNGQLTALSLYRIIEGSYFFANDSLKNVDKVWYDAIDILNEDYKAQPWTRFEAENYTQHNWSVANSIAYSGNNTVYTTGNSPLIMDFAGDLPAVVYTQWSGGGIMNVSIDGGVNYSINQSGPLIYQKRYQLPITPLVYNPREKPTDKIHQIKIFCVNGSGQCDIDALEIRRNDSVRQIWGYLAVDSPTGKRTLNFSDGDYYNETVNITINGTTYPYFLQLYLTAEQRRGAVSYLGMEKVLATYGIWKTDNNVTWLLQQLPILEDRMQWTRDMFYNDTAKLLQIPIWYGSHSFHDGMYSTGYDSVDNSLFVAATYLMSQFYNATGDTTRDNYWKTQSDIVKSQMLKDWTEGGLWKNETIGGHFILTREPGWVRFEVEEYDFNKTSWIPYNNLTGVWGNGKKISGPRSRPFNQSFFEPYMTRRIFYYVDNNNLSIEPIKWSFNGTGLRIVYMNDVNRGILNVSIDGINHSIDQYAGYNGATAAQTVTDVNLSLPMGKHDVLFYPTGKNNISAIGTPGIYVDVDAVEVLNATLIGFPAYAMTPMTLGLFPEWYKNATVNWINWHDPGLKTDYTYPNIPNTIGSIEGDEWKYQNPWSWGYICCGALFENSGHFPVTGAMFSRVSGNYSDLQQWVKYETGKYGMREHYPPNGSEISSAELETQMSGAFLTGFIPFWGAPPSQVTGLVNDTPTQMTVNISWNSVTGASYYQIFRNSNSLGYTKNFYWNDTVLTAYTLYQYQVRANNSYDNWGINSSILTVQTASATKGTISGVVTDSSLGLGIREAVVKLAQYPQYNTTTSSDGSYTIENVTYGPYNIIVTAVGYTKNVSTVNVNGSVVKNFSLSVGSVTGDYRYYAINDSEIASNKVSTLSDIGTNFTIPQYGDNIGWHTEVYVTDYSGLGANLTLLYYYPNGTLAVVENPSVPANGTYEWIPSDGTNGRPTTGKLAITSTRNIVGEYRIYSLSNTDMITSKLYTAADTGTNLTIPQYGDNVGWGTWVAISDASGTGANLTLKYYYPNGTLAATEYPNITANGMYTTVTSDGSNGRPTTGKLAITSNNPVTGEYRIYSFGIGGIMANKLYTPTDKRNRFIIPQYGDNIAWSTWVAISDASGLGANMTIEYYYPNGTLAATEYPNITANGMYTTVTTDGSNGRPTTGKLVISSDNVVSGEMRIYHLSGRGIMANSLFTQQDIDNILIVPYYGDNINLGTYLSLADVSGFNTTIRVDYHYLNGTLAQTEYKTIPADGLLGWVISDGTNGKPREGNIFIYI